MNKSSGLTADLSLAGVGCKVYGNVVQDLKPLVDFDSSNCSIFVSGQIYTNINLRSRLHVNIEDANNIVYQVPTSVSQTPASNSSASSDASALVFSHETSPFSFRITRKSNGEVLFDSSAAPLIFEDQYVRLHTSLPEDPNILDWVGILTDCA